MYGYLFLGFELLYSVLGEVEVDGGRRLWRLREGDGSRRGEGEVLRFVGRRVISGG